MPDKCRKSYNNTLHKIYFQIPIQVSDKLLVKLFAGKLNPQDALNDEIEWFESKPYMSANEVVNGNFEFRRTLAIFECPSLICSYKR